MNAEWIRTPLDSLLKALAGLADSDVGYAFLALAAAGTIAMAILQVIKETTPLRAAFQRNWFRRWITGRSPGFDAAIADPLLVPYLTNQAINDVERSLIDLSTGGLDRALYGMQTEEMVSQLKQTLPIVLDEPKSFPAALILLSLTAARSDLKLLFDGQPADGGASAYFDARARVTRRMERNLDGVRIAMSDRWKLWMQLTSLLLTTMVVQLAVVFAGSDSVAVHLLAIPVGIFGGYFAPITRDLLAALQKLRQPTI